MENRVVHFARSFLPILTFGELAKEVAEDHSTPGHSVYNGYISSLVVFISTASLAFTMSLCLPIGAKLSNIVSSCSTLITLMTVGIGAMIWLSASNSRRRPQRNAHVNQINVGRLGQHINRLLRDNLSLIGITLFFCLSCVPEIFHIIAPANCAEVWSLCVAPVRNESFMRLAFHVVRIIYIGAELMFCFQFHRVRFGNSWPVRCGLMIIQSANLSLWFDAVIWEGMHSDGIYNDNITATCGHDFGNATDKIVKCLAADTYEYRTLNEKVDPYFFPFIIEFTLLTGECFGHLFFQCQPDAINGCRCQQTTNSHRMDDVTESGEETEPLLSSYEERYSSRKSLITKITLIVSVLINVTFCILAFLSVYKDVKSLLQMYFNYHIFIKSSEVVCILLGYIFARSLKPIKTSFSGLDYLVILCACGAFMSHYFAIIAIEGLNEISTSNGTSFETDYGFNYEIFLSAQVINVIQVFLQVTFVLFAERVTASARSGPHSVAVCLFKALLLYLALCNCSNWLVDSFIIRYLAFEETFFVKWYLVGHVLSTLKLFFRFSSFLFFIRAFLNN